MKNWLLSHQPLKKDLGIFLLRLTFGGMFVYHGIQKIQAYEQYASQFPNYLGAGSEFTYLVVIFAELGCGLLTALGFFTRLTVIPIFITMVVAFFVAHAADPFNTKLLPFVYMFLAIVIFVRGGGRYSIDHLISREDWPVAGMGRR